MLTFGKEIFQSLHATNANASQQGGGQQVLHERQHTSGNGLHSTHDGDGARSGKSGHGESTASKIGGAIQLLEEALAGTHFLRLSCGRYAKSRLAGVHANIESDSPSPNPPSAPTLHTRQVRREATDPKRRLPDGVDVSADSGRRKRHRADSRCASSEPFAPDSEVQYRPGSCEAMSSDWSLTNPLRWAETPYGGGNHANDWNSTQLSASLRYGRTEYFTARPGNNHFGFLIRDHS